MSTTGTSDTHARNPRLPEADIAVHSNDRETAAMLAASVFAPHRLYPSTERPLRFDLRAASVGSTTVARVVYGPAVTIKTDGLAEKLVISIPRNGRICVHSSSAKFEFGSEHAWLIADGEPVTIHTDAEHQAVSLIVAHNRVENHLRQLLGSDLPRRLTFSPLPEPGERLKPIFAALSAAAGQKAADRLLPPLLSAHLDDLFLTTLLLHYPHNFTDALLPVGQAGSPRVVRRVLEAINDRPEHAWTMGELADVAEASIRTVQVSFRKHVGCSPFEMLRGVRLERAHDDLANPAPGDTVTSISLRWGFSNMGRFASLYRRRYRTSPSETLRQSS